MAKANSTNDEELEKQVEKGREYVETLMTDFLKMKISQKNADSAKDKIPTSTNANMKNPNNDKERIDRLIKNVNNEFLLNVLSPEIKKNEDKKRKHKDWLMVIMGLFLLFQFILVAVIICCFGYCVINAHMKEIPFSDSTIKIIFTFIGTYITSIIIELIAILKYIVKNVFDTSVAGMVSNFKDN